MTYSSIVNELTQSSFGKVPDPALGAIFEDRSLAIDNLPTDWRDCVPILNISLDLDDVFYRRFFSKLPDSWLQAAISILPVLGVTLAVFSDMRTVSLRLKTSIPKIDGLSLLYNLDEMSSFDDLSQYTKSALYDASAANSLVTNNGFAVELFVASDGGSLLLDFKASGNGFAVSVTAIDTLLFEPWIRSFVASFNYYGKQLLRAPDMPHSSIKLVPPSQWAEILKVNDTISDYPRDNDLISALLEANSLCLTRTAVVSGTRDVAMNQLLSQARSIAKWLTSICEPSGRGVGVVVDRNADTYALYIGILMAGGYYVPVSPDNPASRIDEIFNNADVCTCIIVDGSVDLTTKSYKFSTIQFENNVSFEPRKRSPGSIAYAMYTSGSTGKPKGVLITDRNIICFATTTNHINWNIDDRIGAISSQSFDASTFELWSALLNRVTIVCLPKNAISDLTILDETVKRHRVSVMVITSALLSHIVTANIDALSSLRYLLYGGEVTPIETVRRLCKRYPELELIHAYGPTENTVLSTFYSVSSSDVDRLPIGRPLLNSFAWVVDSGFRPLPVGVRGQLIVSGDRVASGYISQPMLTSKQFVTMPVNLQQRVDERGYLTGDIVRWNDELNLEFLGRIDNQIKIRGYRIELDEIRSTLTSLHDVTDAEIIPIESEPGKAIALEGFVVLTGDMTIEILRAELTKHLPDYMVPRKIYAMQSLPFTSTGKIDRAALLKFIETPQRLSSSNARDDIDRRLLDIWKKLFGVDEISIDDSYVALGGHSMMMLEMADMVYTEFNIDIALTDLVVFTTVRQISDSIKLSVN
jgi:amino acid adenylation domain-containing protein